MKFSPVPVAENELDGSRGNIMDPEHAAMEDGLSRGIRIGENRGCNSKLVIECQILEQNHLPMFCTQLTQVNFTSELD